MIFPGLLSSSVPPARVVHRRRDPTAQALNERRPVAVPVSRHVRQLYAEVPSQALQRDDPDDAQKPPGAAATRLEKLLAAYVYPPR